MPVITLLTDFGLGDGFVGVMKGVIWGICPHVQIADISHEITPQDVLQGAYVLQRAYGFFPSGTVHLAVVDPGVGTGRRPLALRAGEWFFVGPDNGLFTPVFEQAEEGGWRFEVIHLTESKYWLSHVSRTFHGRDIFAPVAAYLASGVPLEEFGSAIHDPMRIAISRAERTTSGWIAHILVIDRFGNLATDLLVQELTEPEKALIRIGGLEIRGITQTYGDHPPGSLIALTDSEGRLEVALVNGSAAHLLGVKTGDSLEISGK